MSNDLSILRRVEPFASLDEHAFTEFRNASELHEVHAGRTLGESGQAVDSAYVLVEGAVVEEWPDGILRHQDPGAILIPTALLSDGPCMHTWRVEEDASVRRLSRESFEELFASNSGAAQSLLVVITELLAIQLHDLNKAFNEIFKLRTVTSEHNAPK